MRVLNEAQSELKERSAALNTQLRFGRERSALLHAYKLRAYLQLRGARLETEQRELQRVETVIAELETRKASGIQRLIKSIIEMAKAALNPEVDDESTLLDQFKAPLPGDEELDLGDMPELGDSDGEPPPARSAPPTKRALPDGEDGWGQAGTQSSAAASESGGYASPAGAQSRQDGWSQTSGSGLTAASSGGFKAPPPDSSEPDGWGASSQGLTSASSGGFKAPVSQPTDAEDGWGAAATGLTASSSGGFARPKDAGSSGGWGNTASWATTSSAGDSDDWGGKESWASEPKKKPATEPESAEDDHWGGSGGYSYDDKF